MAHPLADHILVLHGAYGRLCNRLIQLAHLMALQQEVGLAGVAYPALSQYAHLFADPQPLFLFPADGTRCRQIEDSMTRLETRLQTGQGDITGFGYWYFDDAQPIDMLGAQFTNAVSQRDLAFVRGWGLRVSEEVLDRHAQLIRSRLALHPDSVAKSLQLVAGLRTAPDVRVVGVHVRQTDLRTWQEGRYFYPPQAWIILMEAMEAAAPELSLRFVIATDEPGCIAQQQGRITCINGNEAEDLAALGACDLILCPPTTFGPWAGFIGGVPVRRIPDMDVLLEGGLGEVIEALAQSSSSQ